jgi:hypothetical protein
MQNYIILKKGKMAKLTIGGMNATKGGWFSWLQRFVTGHKATHSFVIFSRPWLERVRLLDARYSVTLDAWEDIEKNPNHEYWLFSIEIPKKALDLIEKTLDKLYMGQTYGVIGLPWFIWRRLNELVGRDIRKKDRWFNFMKEGVWCSEMNWQTLDMVASISDEYKFIKEVIDEWLPDNFHSGDNKEILYTLASLNPLVKLIKQRYK